MELISSPPSIQVPAKRNRTPVRRPGAHPRVVIVGGGTAGITVAARLTRRLPGLDVAVVEPSTYHYYQPLWTLVAGGVFPKELSQRREASVMPKQATWIPGRVAAIDPHRQTVTTNGGNQIGYPGRRPRHSD